MGCATIRARPLRRLPTPAHLMHRLLAVFLLWLLVTSPRTEAQEIFVEVTGTGLDFVHFNGMSGEFYMPEINSGGGAVFDYDGDGDLDLYLVQGSMLGPGKTLADARVKPMHPEPLTDRLYRNDSAPGPDGRLVLRFTDVTLQSGLETTTGYGFGVAAGDYDNDGRIDLYVTQLGSNLLLRNLGPDAAGHFRFEDVAATAGADDPRWSVPASFADYDHDGRLDLFVGNYVDFTYENHKVCRTSTGAQDYCGPSAYVGVPDRLLRNRGPGADGKVSFEDVSTRTGPGRVPSKTLGVVAADLNGDGRLDFYIANDLEANQMWMQQPDGTFSDEALLAGSAVNVHGQAEASMGVDAGDFDNDGDEDLFMTHLTGETNTLYANDGTGLFDDATADSGLGPPSWPYTSWGNAWLDYDNDGWLEMMIANGAVRVIEELANRGDPFPFHQKKQLFHNLGPGADGKVRFEEVTARAGRVFELSESGRGIAAGDLDNDGDTDVLLVNNNGPARILLNNVGQDRSWIGVRLVGQKVERDMLGTRVAVLRPGGKPLWRRVRTDGSFASANDPRVLFGLGDFSGSVSVRAVWPSGRVEEWQGLSIRRYHTLREGSGRSVP